MIVSVVDASAVAAVLFDEPEAAPILATIRGRLLAPSLLRYELARVCAVKIARTPGRADELLARHALLDRLDLLLVEPEWHELPGLARRHKLSAYDAAYLQLALQRKATLVTLDARLAKVFDALASVGQ